MKRAAAQVAQAQADEVAVEPAVIEQPAASSLANDPRIAALEAKFAAFETEKAQALVLERAKEADAQISALAESGAHSLAMIEDTTNQAISQLNAASANHWLPCDHTHN